MPKRRSTNLVSQHLENMSRDALETYQHIIRNYVRHRHGVYALYRRGKLYYVGLARNLRNRLKHHLRNHHGGSWDRFSIYLTIGDTHLRELEAMMLRIVQPRGNKQRGKLPRSENLERRFARDVREMHLKQLRALLGSKYLLDDAAEDDRDGEGRAPVLAKYIDGPLKLRATYKGKPIKARVRRDGRIRFNGKTYRSPSVAGAAAVKRRSCNGWTFWTYERAPGDWVHLDELRR